ncbi:MAG: TadE family protein [Candidatus Brocadiaceae bacterium]
MRKLSARNGGAAVEFAIIVPFLFMVMFGIIEFGLILYDQQIITNASREGARLGIVVRDTGSRVSDSEINSCVNNYCANNLITFGAGSTPTITITRTGTTFGNDLTVRVVYHYNFLVFPNFISSFVGGKDLKAQTVMKME